MSHDPLCLLPQVDYPCKQCWEIDCECTCICGVIAEVREYERKACLPANRMKLDDCSALIRDARDKAIAECIAAVEYLYINDNDPDWDWPIQAATRVLRDLEEKS